MEGKGGENVADEVKVSPAPIQRNVLDVAVELTLLYYSNSMAPINCIEDVQETFAKMFAVANASHRGKIDGNLLLPESLQK
jgi:hypothetical protein